MLNKIAYVADYEGRSVNSHVLVQIRENIKTFEDMHGEIAGNIARQKCETITKINMKSNRAEFVICPFTPPVQLKPKLCL